MFYSLDHRCYHRPLAERSKFDDRDGDGDVASPWPVAGINRYVGMYVGSRRDTDNEREEASEGGSKEPRKEQACCCDTFCIVYVKVKKIESRLLH